VITGGGLLASAKSAAAINRGNDVIIGGLGIQIVFFGFFIAVAAIFHRRVLLSPTPKSRLTADVPWRPLMFVIYTASALIMVRSMYRVVEYGMGPDSIVQTREYFLYIFDSLPMVLVTLMFNWFHPSRVVRRALASDIADPPYALEQQGAPGA
jgi:hypothetical protein